MGWRRGGNGVAGGEGWGRGAAYLHDLALVAQVPAFAC